LCDRYTVGANIAGIPGISIPFGEDEQSLPLGLQMLAAPSADESLLNTAAGLESLRDQAGIRGARSA